MVKKGKVSYKLITDVVLVLVITAVFAIGFFPQKIAPIYGGKKVSVYYNGDKSKQNVSLMINVYENGDVVTKMLSVFSEHNVNATFFIGGCWADDNGELLNKIRAQGHEIANHGYFHKDHKKLDYAHNKEEIYLTGKIINALCGATPTLFQPPSGSYSQVTLDACEDLGYKMVMWTKDTIDWRDSDEDLIFKRATQNVTNGDLILMHPKQHTLNVLPKIIEYIKSVNLNLVTVSNNIQTEV